MNERIDELLWQAGGFNKISNPNDSYLDGKYILSQEQLDMFAELIVKECCFTGEQWVDGLIDPKHYAFVNKMIREHFGVKE